MKKILVVLFLFVASTAFADTCAKRLLPVFTDAQARALCSRGLQLVEPSANFETVAAAGTTQSDAAALSGTKFFHRITGANGIAGFKLPTAGASDVGEAHVLFNTTAGVALVYPATGATVNGGAANAVFTALTGIKPIICYTTAANTWICS